MPKRFSNAQRARLRQALIDRDGEKCALCDRKPPDVRLEIDHIQPEHLFQSTAVPFPGAPQSRPNTILTSPHTSSWNGMENLRLLCVPCNRGRQFESRRAFQATLRPESRAESRPPVTVTHTDTQRTRPREPYPEGLDVTDRVRQEIDYEHAPAQMVANAAFEPRFRDVVMGLIESDPAVPWLYGELRDAGAEAVGCSVQTAADYLAKMVSRVGKLEKVRGGITGSVTIVRLRQQNKGGPDG